MKRIRKFFKSLKDYASRTYRRIASLPWRKIGRLSALGLVMSILVAAIAYCAYSSYEHGYDKGRRDGQCEVGCALMDMEFAYQDEDAACWCSPGPGAYYQIPLKKEY